MGSLCLSCSGEPTDGGGLLCYEIVPPASCTVSPNTGFNLGPNEVGWCFSCGGTPRAILGEEDAGAVVIIVISGS